MLKELTPKEALKKLYDEGIFEAYVKDGEHTDWEKEFITGIDLDEAYKNRPFMSKSCRRKHCAIEVHEEYEPYPDDVCPPLNCGDVIILKSSNIKYLVIATGIDMNNHIQISLGWHSNQELFSNYTHIDGSPIGRIKAGIIKNTNNDS